MNVISSTDGLILLCFFVIFLGYSIAISKNTNEKAAEIEIKALSWWKSITFILLGLAALIFGGQIFVNGAIGIARGLGISEAVIGVTIVAIGTSLPELATSVVAAMKKNPEIAIGNIIGSNLFNIFFILGCSATITPLFPKGISNFDYLWLVASSILLWFFGLFFGKRIIMAQVPMTALLLVLCGLCTSVMWGSIFNLAVEGLGKYTAMASGTFMMMVVGGGVLPLFQNWIADVTTYKASYGVIVIALAFILFYAAIGSKNVNKNIKVD